ncbi:MAG: EF-P beta-lysylation protein EpmB [Thermoguttaceae bacterium]|nr:EF-P beta-lysylation protein EpmB [Thermoguttaceae bacterium]
MQTAVSDFYERRSLSALEKTLKTRFIVDVDEFCRRLELPNDFAKDAREAARAFPFLFPESALSRIRKGDPNDPLLRQFLPRPNELDVVPGFETDPLCEQGELAYPDAPCLLQKYAGRVLALTTNACAARCRFCFRRHFPKNRALFPLPTDGRDGFNDSPDGGSNRSLDASPTPESNAANALNVADVARAHFDRIFAGVRADASISEVIFSGGDPLTLDDAELRTLLHYIRTIESVKRVRFHTRVPVLCPGRIGDDFPSADEFARAPDSGPSDSTRLPLVLHLTLHVDSANEIDSQVERALLSLRRRGYILTSQTVLLQGVNDSVDALAALFEKLIDVGVLPYYLHQLDRTQGAAAFEVSPERGLEIVRRLGERLPGYAVPRYVRELPNRPMKTKILQEKLDGFND